MSKIIGIDLGTTNSCMCVLEGGEPSVIVNADGMRTTPSVVAYTAEGDRVVGKTALNQQAMNPQNTIYSVKRFIGRTYDELTQEDFDGLHYEVRRGEKNRPVICAGGFELLPEEVSAAVLSRMKADAEKFLGEPVDRAVITVPAYFNDDQRQATKDAGKIAGLTVDRIVNEPTAAALAYGFGKGDDGLKKVMVFDLGGGTLDVSILDITSDMIQVVSTAGDNHLGGDDWDRVLCDYLCKRFEREQGASLTADAMTHARVLEAARQCKEGLSNTESYKVSLPFVTIGPSGPLHMDYDITRAEFQDITRELLERCRKPITAALAGTDANPIDLTPADIDAVLLVGGSSRMPAVQQLVREVMGKDPEQTVNPDEVVAEGAAIQGSIVSGDQTGIILQDVNSMSLGVKLANNTVCTLIPANTPIPFEATDMFSTAANNQTDAEIVIVQGENTQRWDAPENKVLGSYSLVGIPAAPAGVPQIEVTLSYDVNGIVQLSAVEKGSGASLNVQIRGTSKLDEDEVNVLAAAERRRNGSTGSAF